MLNTTNGTRWLCCSLNRSRRSCSIRPQRWLEPSLTPVSAISPMHWKFKADLVLWNKANYIVFKRRETCALDCKYEKEKRTWLKNKPIQGNKLCAKQNVHYTQHYLKTLYTKTRPSESKRTSVLQISSTK